MADSTHTRPPGAAPRRIHPTAAGTAVWQSPNEGGNGDWSQAAHWVGGTIGAAGLVVDLGPGGVPLNVGFTITGTNDAALDLNIQIYVGTFAPTGTLTVADTLAITGGTLLVDGGLVTSSVGSVDIDFDAATTGVVVLEDGGTWNSGSLEIGVGAAGNVVLRSGTGGTGGTLDISGVFDLGSARESGAGGHLSLGGGSKVFAGTLDAIGASTVSLDASSMIAVGTSLSLAVPGAILIGAGATMDAAGATIEGNIIDDGMLLAVSPLPVTSIIGPTITGTLSGDGIVPIEYALSVASAAGFSGSFSLDPGADLTVGSGALPLADVSMLNATVDLRGVGLATPVYTAATGLLVVGGITLNVGTGFAQPDFTTTGDNQGGVLIEQHPYDSWIADGNQPSGDWTSAGNWLTGAVPVADTTVEIGNSLSTGNFTVTVSTAGQAAEELTLDAGGLVISGGLAIGDTLDVRGAPVTVDDGGSLSAGTLQDLGNLVQVNHGVLTTTSGDIDYGVIVQDGGVWNAGAISGPSADLFLQTGSTDQGGTLDVSGTLQLGTLSATGASLARAAAILMPAGSQITLDSVGAVVVGSGPTIAGAVAIDAGAAVSAEAAGIIIGNVIDNGTLSVFDFGAPGNLQVQGTLGGGGLVMLAQATLEVAGAAGFAGTITLDQSVLTLDAGSAAHALLRMASGGTVDLPSQPVPAHLFYNGTSGQLLVGTTTLEVGQGLAAVDFSAVGDNAGGTLLTQTSTVPCYAAGTRIATAHGEVPVEALRPGDTVRTAGGRLAPVAWVGRSRIDLGRHPAPRTAAPIRIEAGALGPGLPRRDLLVSPDHALAVGDALVPARKLANGASIASAEGLPAVNYVHVELDRHDLLLAEGVAAESFLDTGNRGLFAEAHGVRPLFPDFAATEAASLRAFAERGCAPLLLEGPVVAAEHARLVARAAALGHRQTGDADLRVEADHPATEATARPDGVALRLPAGMHRLRFRSRSFVPAELDPARPDGRVLGVVLAVRLDGAVPPSEAFAFGWYAPEGDGGWRWTDGDAALILDLRRPAELSVRLLPVGARYWVERPVVEDERQQRQGRRP